MEVKKNIEMQEMISKSAALVMGGSRLSDDEDMCQEQNDNGLDTGLRGLGGLGGELRDLEDMDAHANFDLDSRRPSNFIYADDIEQLQRERMNDLN